MNQFLQLTLEIIVGTIAGAIIGAIIENYFSIGQRLIRAFYKAINKKGKINFVVWVSSNLTFSEFKKEIVKSLKSNELLDKVKKENNIVLEINTNDFYLTIQKHSEKIFIIETENERAGIRDLKDDLRKIVTLIGQLNKNKKIESIENLSLDLYLPYLWKHLKLIPPKGYKLTNYEMEYNNQEYKSRVKVDINKVNFKDVSLEQVTDVINDFTSIL